MKFKYVVVRNYLKIDPNIQSFILNIKTIFKNIYYIMISDIDRLKIEKIYYDQVNDSDYSRNKALILIATKIGINYKDIETAHNYLKKVIFNTNNRF